MAVRESKRALVEAAELLNTDPHSARTYLRSVQRIAGPIQYGTIVAAMRRADLSDVEAVAALATELARRDEASIEPGAAPIGEDPRAPATGTRRATP